MDAESAFCIRELADDWDSINHIDKNLIQNEKNVILNKYNGGEIRIKKWTNNNNEIIWLADT